MSNTAPPAVTRLPLLRVAGLFLWLGVISFGGRNCWIWSRRQT